MCEESVLVYHPDLQLNTQKKKRQRKRREREREESGENKTNMFVLAFEIERNLERE